MKDFCELFKSYTSSMNIDVSLIDLSNQENIYVNSQRSLCNDFCSKFNYSNCEFHCKNQLLKCVNQQNEVVYTCPFGLSYSKNIIKLNSNLILICTGKVFLDEPDLNYYEDLSNKLNYDSKSFINAVKAVPIISNDRLFASNNYIKSFLTTIKKKLPDCNDEYNHKSVDFTSDNLDNHLVSSNDDLLNSLIFLKKVNQKLYAENNLKNRFISSMSHELRVPLNAVLGFNDLLSSQYYGPLNNKQQEYVDLISKSASHLLSLIDDLIDIARIDSGSVVKKVEKVDITKVINDTISLMNPQIKNKNITLNCISSRNQDYITCSEKHARQILINLISNAVKFTHEGGYVEVRVENFKNEAKITVSDNGIGIKSEDLDKIFFDFFQSEYSKDKVSGGSGIGLALTKRLVESYKGEIGVKSRFGKGSLFWFTMPTITSQTEQNKVLVNEY